jgi:hypothetical protein
MPLISDVSREFPDDPEAGWYCTAPVCCSGALWFDERPLISDVSRDGRPGKSGEYPSFRGMSSSSSSIKLIRLYMRFETGVVVAVAVAIAVAGAAVVAVGWTLPDLAFFILLDASAIFAEKTESWDPSSEMLLEGNSGEGGRELSRLLSKLKAPFSTSVSIASSDFEFSKLERFRLLITRNKSTAIKVAEIRTAGTAICVGISVLLPSPGVSGVSTLSTLVGGTTGAGACDGASDCVGA